MEHVPQLLQVFAGCAYACHDGHHHLTIREEGVALRGTLTRASVRRLEG